MPASGGVAPQESDWIKHNAVLFDCVHLPWPVVLAEGTVRWPLVYYLAYYLPAAVVGKMAGYAAAQAALWAWSSLGVTLACLWFARLTRLPVALAPLAFFSFAGLDIVGSTLMQIPALHQPHEKLLLYPNESWSRIWQFPGHFWMLAWAPGQALGGWLAAGLFLSSPKPLRAACVAFLFTCLLLWSPFALVGLCLLAFFLAWREGLEWPAQGFAPLLALILPIGVLMAFYAAKISPEAAARFPKIPVDWFFRFHKGPGPVGSVLLLLLFVAFEFGIFLGFIRARFPKGTGERNLADACGLALICLLPVTVGDFNDLSMRASVVPLFCLALLLARTAASAGFTPAVRRWFWLVILIGFLTPFVQLLHQGFHLATRRYDPRTVPHQVSAVVNMADGGFETFGAQYTGSTNSFFSKNLAR